MKKKIAAFLLALTMAFTMTAVAEGVSGEYTGTSKGYGGDVTVTLTLDNGKIVNASAEGAKETEGIGGKALAPMAAKIAETGSVAVDGMTGATVTSKAVIEAARAALTAAGLNPEDYAAVAETAKAEDAVYDCDVVIVGAGGAGMTAAKTARQDENAFGETAGVEKTLKAAADGYADNADVTALAAKVSEQWAAYQQNPTGYFDSVELFELDTMIGGKGVNDMELVKTLCESSAASIDWLDSVGANLTSVGSFGGASVKRIHRPVNDAGKTVSVGSYIVPILEKNCADRGVQMLMETTATAILTNDAGAVCGVAAAGKDGQTVTVNAKAVILAAGGFGANLEMVASYVPALKGFMTTNAPGILGQGIAMAQAVGAAVVDMEQIQIHPTVQFDTAALITEGLRGDGAILVNAEGKRFIDEVGTRDVVSAAEIAQTGSYSWLVVDQAMVDASSVIQGYINKGMTVSGEDYAKLAEAMGVDAAAFAATMEAWNACVEAKNDAEFGRTSFANPLNTAPYYAIKVTAGVHHTMGGLKINTAAEVLDTENAVIPGLYAAGEITGGVHGANRLGGNAVADFIVFGRIAGENAAEYTK